MNGLAMIGLSHHHAAVEIRERLALDDERAAQVLERLRTLHGDMEVAVLSTCNRTEIYTATRRDPLALIDQAKTAIASVCAMDRSQLDAVTVVRRGPEAVRHLLKVACGLDSMVLGETQVLGQAKHAYRRATEHDAAGPVLHCLFQSAFKCAKEVHTTTGIGQGNMSVATAAVHFAQQIFATFEDKTVLGLGAGAMAKITLRQLRDLAPKRLWVANRTEARAVEVARALALEPAHGGPRGFDALDDLIVEADVIVCATGARTPVITAARMRRLARRRRHRPLFILDIAVPRDVAPDVRHFPDIYLHDLDDLQAHLDQVMQGRQQRLEACHRLIDEHARQVAHQLQHANIGRMIRRLRKKLHALATTEQRRTVRKLTASSDADAGHILDQHTHRLINKILYLPLQKLNTPEEGPAVEQYAQAIEALFALNDQDEAEQSTRTDVR